MMKQELIQNQTQVATRSIETVSLDKVGQLISRLQNANALKASFRHPKAWQRLTEVPSHELACTIRDHLSKAGWRHVVEAMRFHNRQVPDNLWDLSKDIDFLAAIELGLRRQALPPEVETQYDASEDVPIKFTRVRVVPPARGRRGDALLSRNWTAFEEKRAEAKLISDQLPGLLDDLYEANPLREGFLREQVRHKITLLVGGVIAAIGGLIWGVIDGICDVLIVGISHFAPVVAPAMLVGLATLVIETIIYGPPLKWDTIVQFTQRALWNGALAFGATLIIYGTWHYLSSRNKEEQSPFRDPGTTQEEPADVVEAT